MKYIKLFEITAVYNAATLDLPNVSLIKETMSVCYNPYVIPFFCKLTLNNGNVVELEGSGILTSDVISDYSTTVISVEIGKLCTSIDDRAFYNCTGLTSITIPDSVTSIGESVFIRCSDLSNININSGNTVYDSRNNCNAIIKTDTDTLICGCKTTIIPNSVTSIGSSAFRGCDSLTSIDIPDSVTSIEGSAFDHCDSLTSVIIGDSVTSIGYSAFSRCSSLTNITIPDSVTSIGNEAFLACDSLTNVTIGNGVTSIGEKAFFFCDSLTSIISNAMTAPEITSTTFQNINTIGGTLTVPTGSTGYDTWISTDDYYLGKYNWTKVEQ